MKIGDRIFVRGYIDEIRKDTVIVRNDGGYFGTILSEVTGELPSAQPEIKPIDYQDCANAMMKMWMDNVLTDGEYNRIMDKLNKHEMERRKADERSDL